MSADQTGFRPDRELAPADRPDAAGVLIASDAGRAMELVVGVLERGLDRCRILDQLRADLSAVAAPVRAAAEVTIGLVLADPRRGASLLRRWARRMDESLAVAGTPQGEAILARMRAGGVTAVDMRLAINAATVAASKLEGC
jgi:hypothetical protein